MKPRYRPGKAITSGRSARDAVMKSKPLSQNQMQHLQEAKPVDATSLKAGRKGKRADWNIDYAEGVECDKKSMPYRESERLSIDGTRRVPKKGS